MWGTNPTYMFERALHLHSTHERNQSNIHVRKGSALTFVHARNQSSMHVRRACTHILSCRNQSYSHIIMVPSPILSYLVTDQVPPFLEWNSMLTSDHVGTNPTVSSEWLSIHIWHGRNQSSHHDRMAQPLHLTMKGTNPLTMSEWLWVSSFFLGGNLDMENTNLLPEVLKL